ncbi:hypothetical protein Ahy_A07g034971 [Arachis hypogaea]|uniref:Uncharacterized protein n=1 Tax=Arachis hypogaea TaxID=3818 RepID=A0A445CDF6_ARAHY|nr:hypothetical protein Ahy_A07g034971 [Arachis hypogaea]
MHRKGKEKANPLDPPPPVPLRFDPVEINENQVKEFYENLLRRDTTIVFLRGVTLDTSDHAFEALLQIPHIPPAHDTYPQIVKDLTSGKLLLDVVLKKIAIPEAKQEYSRGENAVLPSIACSDLTLEARIWQQIIADYNLQSTHATHIRVRVAVLLWAILEGKRISILLLIRDSITQPFLPYGEYKGPPQKKRKTTELPSSVAEPSAPLAPPAPTPRPQTPYELGREILLAIHHSEHHNARHFEWIIVKLEGRDPGPPLRIHQSMSQSMRLRPRNRQWRSHQLTELRREQSQ